MAVLAACMLDRRPRISIRVYPFLLLVILLLALAPVWNCTGCSGPAATAGVLAVRRRRVRRAAGQLAGPHPRRLARQGRPGEGRIRPGPVAVRDVHVRRRRPGGLRRRDGRLSGFVRRSGAAHGPGAVVRGLSGPAAELPGPAALATAASTAAPSTALALAIFVPKLRRHGGLLHRPAGRPHTDDAGPQSKKTWEGFAGGMLGAVAAALFGQLPEGSDRNFAPCSLTRCCTAATWRRRLRPDGRAGRRAGRPGRVADQARLSPQGRLDRPCPASAACWT